MERSSPFTVAVVDDDATIRRLITLYLKRNAFDVIECATGEDARRILHEFPWDLAILDRRLPDIDGLDLCVELKSDARLRNRYVIVLTGKDEPSDKLEGFDLGADDYVTKPFQPPELLARIRAAKRIVDLQNELIESNRRLERLSITDGLTQLHNHRHFQEQLARAFEESARYRRPLALALIDIDHFKRINDTWGHASGDEVLKVVSRIFAESVRGADLVARYGGEEFAVMMPETDLDDARLVAEKIRQRVEATSIDTDQASISATVSIGVAAAPRPALPTPMALIEAADRALYRAKREGRNQVRLDARNESPSEPARLAEHS